MRGVQNNPPVRRSRAVKRELVAAVARRVAPARLVIVVHFEGVNGPKAQELRRLVERLGGRYHVVKNTLARRAFAGSALADYFVGSCGIVTGTGDPDPLLVGFRDYLDHKFRIRLHRIVSGDSVRTGLGGSHMPYRDGHRSNANTLDIAAVAIDGQVLSPDELATVLAARGVAKLRAALLRAMQPPAQFAATLAAPVRDFLAVLTARAAS